MNQDQFLGILRAIIPAGTAYAVGKGWIPVGSSADVGVGVLALGSAVWSYFAHSDSAKVSAAATVRDVKKVVIDSTSSNTAIRAAAADNTQSKITTS